MKYIIFSLLFIFSTTAWAYQDSDLIENIKPGSRIKFKQAIPIPAFVNVAVFDRSHAVADGEVFPACQIYMNGPASHPRRLPVEDLNLEVKNISADGSNINFDPPSKGGEFVSHISCHQMVRKQDDDDEVWIYNPKSKPTLGDLKAAFTDESGESVLQIIEPLE